MRSEGGRDVDREGREEQKTSHLDVQFCGARRDFEMLDQLNSALEEIDV